MNKILNNKKGIALIMVIILLVAVGSLVGVLMTSEVFNISFIDRETNETKAFYLAEAGVERARYLYKKYGENVFEGDHDSLQTEEIDFLESEKIKLDPSETGSYYIKKNSITKKNDLLYLDIVGEFNNQKEIIGITFNESSNDNNYLFDDALFISGNNNSNQPSISLGNGTEIIGDVKTNLSDYNLIDMDNSKSGDPDSFIIDGDLFLNMDTSFSDIYQKKGASDEEWSSDKTPYSKGDIVWYDGLYYKAEGNPKSIEPGTDSVWQIQIPEGEIWPWFETQNYKSGDQVWYNDNFYTLNGNAKGVSPDESNSWYRNVSGTTQYMDRLVYEAVEFPDFTNQADDDSDISTSTQSDIIGRVIDDNNNGLEDVKLYLSNGELEESQDWGSIGNFKFYSVKGTVTITPVKNGYIFEPESIEVTHPSDEIVFKAISKSGKTYDENNIKTSEPTEYKIKGGEEYDKIDIANEVPLVIDMEEGDKTITVNELKINGDIELINVAEDSHLSINVTDEFALNGSGRLNPSGEINNVTVFYQGTNDINIAGGTELNGNLFINKADLTFTGGSSIKGHVISNGENIKISGGTNVESRIIYAPNTDVTLTGGGEIKGSIIAKTFEAKGGTTLEYDESPFVSDIFEDLLDVNLPNNETEIEIVWFRK